MKRFDAVGFGALNCDHILLGNLDESYFRQDDDEGGRTETSIDSDPEVAAGGSAANTIYGLGKLGLRTAFMGGVGDDNDGRVILDGFGEVGTDTTWIRTYKNAETGRVDCISGNHGRLLLVSQGANAMYSLSDAAEAMAALIPRTRLFHLTSFVGNQQQEAQVQLVKKLPSDTLLSCAPGKLYVDLGFSRIEPLLERADYSFFNLQEITALLATPSDDYELAARTYLSNFPRSRAVAITLGSGLKIDNSETLITSVVFDRLGRSLEVKKRLADGEVVDTTGAGDAYASGFLYGVLGNYTFSESALMADIIAGASITGAGARSTLPNRTELQHELTLNQSD